VIKENHGNILPECRVINTTFLYPVPPNFKDAYRVGYVNQLAQPMITKAQFNKLRNHSHDTCVSIYIPTIVAGDYEKNRIRWKNAVDACIKELEEIGVNTDFLAEAVALDTNSEYWAHQSRGLAGFFSPSHSKIVHLVNEPISSHYVSDHYILQPLVPELSNDDRVFVLAISKNETKFYEAVIDGIFPVFIDDCVVEDQGEALQNIEMIQTTQHHSGGGPGTAIFHATGPGSDKDSLRTEQYLRRIDDGIMEIISDEKVPLVLACVEEYVPIYRKVSKYNHLSDHYITGNPSDLTPTDLRKNVEPVFQELKKERHQKFEELYRTASSTGASIDQLDQIAASADMDNIGWVLISKHALLHITDEQRETVDDIVQCVYATNGEILFTDEALDSRTPVMAIQRAPMPMADLV